MSLGVVAAAEEQDADVRSRARRSAQGSAVVLGKQHQLDYRDLGRVAGDLLDRGLALPASETRFRSERRLSDSASP